MNQCKMGRSPVVLTASLEAVNMLFLVKSNYGVHGIQVANQLNLQ